MSYADKVFVAMCQDILENGTTLRESWCVPTGRTAQAPIQ